MSQKSKMTRKDFLKTAAVGAGAVGLTACGMPPSDANDLGTQTNNMNSHGQGHGHGHGNRCNTKGRIDLDLIRGVASIPGEYVDGRVCDMTNKKARVEWDKNANKVRIRVRIDNVPYRPTVTRPPGTDASTTFSAPFPVTVVDARYQIWLVMMSPVRARKFYYDCNSFECLGSDAYLQENNIAVPPDALIIHMPVTVLCCSPMIDPINVQGGFGDLRLDWKFDYDKVIDAAGNGGQESTYGPTNLKTHAGQYRAINARVIPPAEAYSFDEFLRGNQFAIDSTFEPFPKPPGLVSRFNPMIIASQISAFPLPEGVFFDLHEEVVKPYPQPCGDYTGPLKDGKNTCT